jgi:hypothetical protein
MPIIATVAEAGPQLRAHVNNSLRAWQTIPAFLLTPFKRLGISGWNDYCLQIELSGVAVQSRRSTDGFQTVDIRILQANDSHWRSGSYIRVEVMPSVRRGLVHIPKVGDSYRIKGEVVWDGDGWLEVHPWAASDINFISG